MIDSHGQKPGPIPAKVPPDGSAIIITPEFDYATEQFADFTCPEGTVPRLRAYFSVATRYFRRFRMEVKVPYEDSGMG